MSFPKAQVYVDGFNFYHRAVKGTRYKWLDFHALCRHVLPGIELLKVKYFTARVNGDVDLLAPLRQETYIRALRAAGCEDYSGHFHTHQVWRPVTIPAVANPKRQHQLYSTSPIMVQVSDTKEKRSDVNLAVQLVNDGWQGAYETAVVLSEDSDIAPALEVVKRQLRKRIVLLHNRRRPPADLTQYADYKVRLSEADLAAAQFPDNMPNTSITKPAGW